MRTGSTVCEKVTYRLVQCKQVSFIEVEEQYPIEGGGILFFHKKEILDI
jgi:hypothetical protein